MSATLFYEDAFDLLDADHKQDKVKPSWIVSHELPLEEAPKAYKNFDERKNGWTKVTLKPNG
jgi:threonine dehydrogenase-like Zn-dependent dehydrogenase